MSHGRGGIPPDRPSEGLVSRQQAANERLVLAGIRALEQKDEAVLSQRRAELDVEAARVREAELVATAEFRELLLGIIGHDLRNPLAAIVIAAQTQLARDHLTDLDRTFAKLIVASGHRMGRMIGQLVDFTQARLGGGFGLRLQDCDLGALCTGIADEHRVASPADVVVATRGDLRGIWDPDRLAQVLSNLTGNALDYAAPGTAVEIDVRVDDDPTFLLTTVTNRGECIPSDKLPLLFSAFGRASADATTDRQHLGLGLYIAHEIVRSHGGTLTVRSTDGVTAFTMRLPRDLAPAEAT